ncbi:SpoIIE family protein phosphatase [Streptomyces sp. NBC_00237]|uniref:PP2C family protein-serine/threonine phosphatase n=1 Tax=Streptomyces sp. NBC_00237 TaxID=2975687 RepID=UPI00225A641A|nr:SpoIIE family protein phosphatase [Streptomyces sp. NBC_00237]MCX5207204.1 SpoIIE family protein phosphatase [Streptomyces sp. NBC_00237]
MPSPLFADRSAPQPPERGMVDALITQTRRLRGDMDAVRRETPLDLGDDDAQLRWQRSLCDLAVSQLDDLGVHLGQLKDGLPSVSFPPAEHPEVRAGRGAASGGEAVGGGARVPLLSRVGSAEWNLLTDEVSWSDELYEIFGRTRADGPLSLDELPSLLPADDQALLTAMVTDCLVDGKPIDGEFRIVRHGDGAVRTLHMMGEPVLDADGCTASMWAVLRDVSALRRTQRTVRENVDSLQHARRLAQAERTVAVQLQEAVLPAWRGASPPLPAGDALDLAAYYLPSASGELVGGDWYDALELPDGQRLLTVGGLTGHGVTATSSMAMLLGALRGMAFAGVRPGALMGHLNQLLETTSPHPSPGSAVCCQYDPATRLLTWAQAGHPAPLLFRDGRGQPLTPPRGALLGLLGAASGAAYEQAEVTLRAGDLLLLHTDGLSRRSATDDECRSRLLSLASRFAGAHSARECVRLVLEEFGETEREEDACVLIARVGA